jgi:hypothetical protein
MDHGIEQPLAPTLDTLPVAWILWDVGDHTGIENARAIVRRIKAVLSQSSIFGAKSKNWVSEIQ